MEADSLLRRRILPPHRTVAIDSTEVAVDEVDRGAPRAGCQPQAEQD